MISGLISCIRPLHYCFVYRRHFKTSLFQTQRAERNFRLRGCHYYGRVLSTRQEMHLSLKCSTLPVHDLPGDGGASPDSNTLDISFLLGCIFCCIHVISSLEELNTSSQNKKTSKLLQILLLPRHTHTGSLKILLLSLIANMFIILQRFFNW